MWNIFGRYKGKKALPSSRQMNLIAAILNNVVRGTGIAMETPQLPSTDTPWKIGVDTKWLAEFVGNMVPEGSGSAENPSSITNLADSYPGTASANTASWTAGGENGVSETVFTRAQWSGTYLYGFYRTRVYDKFGRLYSVSAETRYIIATAVTYNP